MQKQLTSILVVALLLLCVPSSYSENQASDEQLTQLAQQIRAHPEGILKLASNGNASAQGLAGNMYLFGWGVPQDYYQARTWFTLGALNNDAESQYYLYQLTKTGTGGPQDLSKAMMWLNLSAKQGHSEAQRYLGGHYYLGIGVPKDADEARMWFTLSAIQGNKEALKELHAIGSTAEGKTEQPVQPIPSTPTPQAPLSSKNYNCFSVDMGGGMMNTNCYGH